MSGRRPGDFSTAQRIIPGLALLAATLTAGTVGFGLSERWTAGESFFETVLVISTLGGLRPMTGAGKVLTVLLISGGVGTLYYLLGALVQGLVETQIGTGQARRLRRQMQQLKDHFIVCGHGRVGQEVARELRREGQPLVVVDADEARLSRIREEGILVHRGDASRDEVLRAAGIERARGLVVCTGSDAVNVFITLSARAMREDLLIVARAIHEDDEPKLMRAGASRTITPASLGGRRLAGLLLRPTVIELLDILARSGGYEILLEEVRLGRACTLAGRSLGQSRLRDDVGVTVLAIKRSGGTMVTNPPADAILHAEDTLVALGTRDALGRLTHLAT